jgi:class 3 adenylate cyclase
MGERLIAPAGIMECLTEREIQLEAIAVLKLGTRQDLLHLGDIIFDDNDIYGDGVNVAARIESIAQPGGVAVSGTVRDHIGKNLDLVFEDMGEQTLKNIDRPVRVYNVVLHASAPKEVAAPTRPATP